MRLALDQNFPVPIINAMQDFMVDIELVSLRRIDPRLSSLDDRELLIALKQLGFPGLVTNNYKMLKNPKELAAIISTKVTVFAVELRPDLLRAPHRRRPCVWVSAEFVANLVSLVRR